MPSEAAGGCVIAKLFRLVTAELLERAVDEARLQKVLCRRCGPEIAEVYVEGGGGILDSRVEPPGSAPDVLAVEIAHHSVSNARSSSPSRSCRIAAASSGLAMMKRDPRMPMSVMVWKAAASSGFASASVRTTFQT